MDFLAPFRKLPHGYFRLLIVGWFIFPFIWGFVVQGKGDSDYAFGLMCGPIVYYIIARIGIWVYDGFKNPKPE